MQLGLLGQNARICKTFKQLESELADFDACHVKMCRKLRRFTWHYKFRVNRKLICKLATKPEVPSLCTFLCWIFRCRCFILHQIKGLIMQIVRRWLAALMPGNEQSSEVPSPAMYFRYRLRPMSNLRTAAANQKLL